MLLGRAVVTCIGVSILEECSQPVWISMGEKSLKSEILDSLLNDMCGFKGLIRKTEDNGICT